MGAGVGEEDREAAGAEGGVMEAEFIRVEIPMLPPKETSPNWRGHWSAKAAAAAGLRSAARVCALQCSRFSRPRFDRAELSVTLFLPDARHITETDNALSSLKPAVDGCIDAEIVVDDSPDVLVYVLPVLQLVEAGPAPLIVLEFRRLV